MSMDLYFPLVLAVTIEATRLFRGILGMVFISLMLSKAILGHYEDV